MDWQAFNTRVFFGNVERCKPHCSFDARKVASSFIVPDFVHGFPCGRVSSRIRRLFMYGPICLIQRFEEVFEKILEKADTGGELDVNVAITFENEPGNVGNGEIIFGVATTMFKIS
jgi:hypothetical protein